MNKKLILLPFLVSLVFLQGCAGGVIFLAGAAVAVGSDERTISRQIADDKLSLAALAKINELDINLRSIRVNFVANEGYLLVIGQVNNEAEKQMISDKLNTLTEAKEVYNQLRINKPITFSQQSKDTWITSKAKSKLTAHNAINPLQIKVITEDSEIFLIGLVNSKAADAATNIASKIAGVKHVHRVFQLTEEQVDNK